MIRSRSLKKLESELYVSRPWYSWFLDVTPLFCLQMPTFALFKDGNKIKDVVGADPEKLRAS